ncbi:hypothetical protein [Thalassospira sp.]|uniref:hypothetical protein n=1 Tax=Thalassospira sp. TaxID=1912094 RepID=UPI0025FE4116|nr:hypothetical protein [Thalassospira sp.]
MNRSLSKEMLESIRKSGLHKPGHSAFVLDFAGIPAARNLTVFCAIVRYVEDSCLSGVRAKLLSRYAISVLVPHENRGRMVEFVEGLNGFLLSRRYGGIDIRLFDLDHETPHFAMLCIEYLRSASIGTAQEFLDFHTESPDCVSKLGELIELERVVGQADMSMHLRFQSLWHLEPGMAPSQYGEEMWVSMAAMEEITGKSILHDPWMFSRFTEFLDNRVLSHITKERSTPRGRQFLNLNPVAAVSANFDRMIKTLPMTQIRQLIVEFALPVWRDNAKVAASILKRFERFGIGLALDAIPIQNLADMSDEELSVARFLKLYVATVQPDVITSCMAKVPKDVLDRVVLCRCETVEQIKAGVQAGAKYFQGYGLPEFLNKPDEVESVLGTGRVRKLHLVGRR